MLNYMIHFYKMSVPMFQETFIVYESRSTYLNTHFCQFYKYIVFSVNFIGIWYTDSTM